ncbi:hypothetical protein [Pimelobacter simplex]|uniref:DUF7302 family protein n=1 Tax=Nocardioides simplex TaxID=2045 RepID=UPI003AADAE9E
MAADLTRLIAPNGAVVNVSAEKAKRLLGEGYTAAKDAQPSTSAGAKAPAKKTAAPRKTAESD